MSEKSEKIKFILERAYIASEIPFRVYDDNGKRVLAVGENDETLDPFLRDMDLLGKIQDNNKQNIEPSIYVEDDIFVYGSFCDEFGYVYMCGPAIVGDMDTYKLEEYKNRHNIIRDDFKITFSTYMCIANILSSTCFVVTNKCYTEEMILANTNNIKNHLIVDSNDINQRYVEDDEFQTGDLSYIYEHKYLMAIENGNIEYFLGAYPPELKPVEKIGKLTNDINKQNEYTCLTSITLVTRAAIRGGLYPVKAYALSELYMKKLEQCKNSYEIIELHKNMRNDFVTRVRDVKLNGKDKDIIEKCKDYIDQQLCYPISVKDIADSIGVNHSYLSRKFVKREGITVVQYCIKSKVTAAANMLKYSEISISEIANYFCFASQSRFGEQFKNEYGVTPKVYRKQNQVIDFIEKK